LMALYSLSVCIKGDDPCPQSISREIISSAGQGIVFVLLTDFAFITAYPEPRKCHSCHLLNNGRLD